MISKKIEQNLQTTGLKNLFFLKWGANYSNIILISYLINFKKY